MRLTAVLAIACLVALAFAGCSGKDKDGGATTSSSSSSSHSSTSATSSSSSHSSTSTTGSSSSTSTGSSNSPPTGSISASINGTRATFNLTATDADGDALAWTLSFGDGNSTNGTALPTTLGHNYTVSGNLTVNFTVTDGQHPVFYNVTLAVGPGAPAAFVIDATFTGLDPSANSAVAGQLFGCVLGDPTTPGGPKGGNWHPGLPNLDGWTYAITPAGVGFSAYFIASDASTTVGSGGDSGTVPAGAAEVDICTANPMALNDPPGGSYTFTATKA